MFFNKKKNPYNTQMDNVEFSDDTYAVILHFTPTAVYVYEDKLGYSVIEGNNIEMWDDDGTILTGTLIVTNVTSTQEALEKYKVKDLGLLVIPVELSYDS
ncbi:hypothetical protein MHZ92_18035 [Sporosarcina sp. ACRSL]|uniref:hypothetical protein n=1 Tax=Sporosarcina sp. ACRSL TaxID=2918215 RepID=UPI001EF6FBF6|nr:hypothetical protein [Sporosarcina sp. ACRSL]MCG7346016.1 hypothetical protein [Sporosarcina sp. ACRSL]